MLYNNNYRSYNSIVSIRQQAEIRIQTLRFLVKTSPAKVPLKSFRSRLWKNLIIWKMSSKNSTFLQLENLQFSVIHWTKKKNISGRKLILKISSGIIFKNNYLPFILKTLALLADTSKLKVTKPLFRIIYWLIWFDKLVDSMKKWSAICPKIIISGETFKKFFQTFFFTKNFVFEF